MYINQPRNVGVDTIFGIKDRKVIQEGGIYPAASACKIIPQNQAA